MQRTLDEIRQEGLDALRRRLGLTDEEIGIAEDATQ